MEPLPTGAPVEAPPGASRAPYPHLFRLSHGLLAAALPWMATTGFALHTVAQSGWSLTDGTAPAWLPGLRWPLLHLLGALVFAPAMGMAAASYLGHRRRSTAPPRRRAVDDLLAGGGLLALLSGILLAHPAGPAWLAGAVRAAHALAAASLVAAFAVHLVQVLGPYRGMIVPAFHPARQPRWAHALLLVPVAALFAWLVPGWFPSGAGELLARRVTPPGDDLGRLPWSDAPPLCVALFNGIGFDGGRTDVELRAFHDGAEIFLRATWIDPREDLRINPWVRTDGGWKRLATAPEDEQVYYEDKLALAFPSEPAPAFRLAGCAAYCHVGGGRAYGFKGTDALVDEWFWKATRTDPFGYADDSHWLGADRSLRQVGRRNDPKTSGGYESNDAKDGPHPAFLPDGEGAVLKGGLRKDRAVPYTEERARAILPGVEVPGIVIGPCAGDRADVRCQSRYAGGRWTVLFRRKLDTGSPNDVRFVPGRRQAFGCAAFDHCSRRHAYTYAPGVLALDP
jgi:hypothetical protein